LQLIRSVGPTKTERHARSVGMNMVLLAICLPTLMVAETKARRPPIIDMHLHAYPRFPPPSDPIWNVIPKAIPVLPAANPQEHLRATLQEMDRYNIVLGVVSGPDHAVLRTWGAAAPGRFVGGCWLKVEPVPEPSVGEFRRAVQGGICEELGELNLAYEGVAPDDARLEPYYELAEDLGIPVGLHASLGPPGTPYFHAPQFRVTLGDPKLVEPVLLRHPRLKIYLMHAGHPYLEATKAIMAVYPQVYADVGVISWVLPRPEFYRYLEALVDAGFADRLMFGSDQVFWPRAIGLVVESLEAAPFLNEQQRRDIFFNNAARFLGLSKDEIAKHHTK
jgi:uncharacterized protein